LDSDERLAALGLWQSLEEVYMKAFLNKRMTFQEQRRARLRGVLEGYGTDVSALDANELEALFTFYLKEYEAAWRPFDDVADTLTYLRGAPGGTAILSNGDRRQQEKKVAALDCTPSPRLFVPADLDAAKPDPASFLGACASMGWEPGTVLYVGDNPETDARPARNAGLRACWLNRHGAPARFDGIPEIPSLTALTELLEWD
jgi:putative hydrolase of the HAD superfamily